jgi:hypothetical protein
MARQLMYARVFLPRRAFLCLVLRAINLATLGHPQLFEMPVRRLGPPTSRSVPQSQTQRHNRWE